MTAVIRKKATVKFEPLRDAAPFIVMEKIQSFMS